MAEPYITMTPRGRYDCLAECSCGWSELCKSQWTAQDRADWHIANAHPQPPPQPAASEVALRAVEDFVAWLYELAPQISWSADGSEAYRGCELHEMPSEYAKHLAARTAAAEEA